MPSDHFLSGNLNKVRATSPCDLEDHLGVLTRINLGNYVAMVRQDMQDML